MGAAYTPLTQFSIGDYAGATQTQDDYAVIGQHGPTLVGDDYGNGRVAAYPLGGADATAAGLIGTRSDLDVFEVTRSCTGSLGATVTPALRSGRTSTRGSACSTPRVRCSRSRRRPRPGQVRGRRS